MDMRLAQPDAPAAFRVHVSTGQLSVRDTGTTERLLGLVAGTCPPKRMGLAETPGGRPARPAGAALRRGAAAVPAWLSVPPP